MERTERLVRICGMLATVRRDEFYSRHSQASNVSEIELCLMCKIFIGVVSISEHPVTLLMIQLVQILMKPSLRILSSVIVMRMEGMCILLLFIIIITVVLSRAPQMNPHQMTKQLFHQLQ